MRILFLSHRLPYPPDKGERIRAYHELKYLAQRHQVDLFCFADSAVDAAHQKACEAMCRSVHVEVLSKPGRVLRALSSPFRGEPMSAGFFYSSSFAGSVKRALRERRYDLVFVYCSSMGQFIPYPAPVPVVVDFVDADSAKWRQYAQSCPPPRSWLYAREARTLAAFEASLGRGAALSLAVTAHDAKELGGVEAGSFAVEVMGNGTEVPVAASDDIDPEIRKLQPFAVFVGTMNYKPNSDAVKYFVRDIFPLLRQRHPRLNFVVVGRDPDKGVRTLAGIPGVTVTGTVPDVYSYLRSAEVSIAPFRISQGFHNKIAESLAVGTPVVTTGRAQAGIGLSEREGLFVAETPAEFDRTVDVILEDFHLRAELRRTAAKVRQLLSWDTRLQHLEERMTGLVRPGAKSISTVGALSL